MDATSHHNAGISEPSALELQRGSEPGEKKKLEHPLAHITAKADERHGWVDWEETYGEVTDAPLACLLTWPSPRDMAGYYPCPRFPLEAARHVVAGNEGNPYVRHMWMDEREGDPGLVEGDAQAERGDWVGPDADGLYSVGHGLLWEVYLPCAHCGRPVEIVRMLQQDDVVEHDECAERASEPFPGYDSNVAAGLPPDGDLEQDDPRQEIARLARLAGDAGSWIGGDTLVAANSLAEIAREMAALAERLAAIGRGEAR